MAKKKNSEEEVIEKIEKINKKMEEINKGPIKKEKRKTKTTSKKETDKKKGESLIKKKSQSKKKKEIGLNVKEIKKDDNLLKEEKENFKIGKFEIVIILINIVLLSCLIGYLFGIKADMKEDEEKYTTASTEIQTFIDQYNYILENYYGEEVNKEKLIESAINGMLNSLDDYSGVIGNSSNSFNITLDGRYEGIGVSILSNVDGEIVVVGVYDDTPASKAGIKPGDILTDFNGESLINVETKDFVQKVKNVENISLTILRGEEKFDVFLKKENIQLKSVRHEMLDNNIGYIGVSLFASNTYQQFENALIDLENNDMEKLIIDLRGNSGGHLAAVEGMLGLFMDGTHIVYQTEDSDGVVKVKSNGDIDKEYKIVILQDGVSASASEIMASSLRENLGAYIIGNTSYGKGTVQQVQVAGNIEYKFTTKKWLTPNGNWINKVGVVPDLEISLTDKYAESPILENDDQYQAALEYLK